MTTRREFIAVTTGALAARVAGLNASVSAAERPLDILFLGGTGFLGPHQIKYALARGHRVTLFNRGSNAGMFGDRAEELIGNRDTRIDDGLNALEGDRRWDVVVDNSGFIPRHVRDSAELLKNRCRRYVYVSTVAVYDFESGGVFPEDAELAPLDDKTVEKVTGATYGPLKAECDRIVRNILGDSVTVVRPTYVVGPGDHTDRFTYWVDRVARGGEVLAPGLPENIAQWVDARDLCPWIVTLGETDTRGIFNAAGPASTFTREGLMWGLAAQTDRPVEFFWPGVELLNELEFDAPMMGRENSVRFVNQASMDAGLQYRSLADSASGTLEWWRAQSAERRANPRRWPSAEKEAEAIARLKKA
jgi:2'-hydroxyisoflavone reductase